MHLQEGDGGKQEAGTGNETCVNSGGVGLLS